MVLLVMSSCSTLLYGLSRFVQSSAPSLATDSLVGVSIFLGLPFNVFLALLCSGLVGPEGDRAAQLEEIRRLAAARRERQIHEKLVEAARRVREGSEVGAACGAALTLAPFFRRQET